MSVDSVCGGACKYNKLSLSSVDVCVVVHAGTISYY